MLGWALPLCAQYAGPAILSRGDAPAAMATPQLSFRPFIEVSAIYDTGLAGVSVNPNGDLANSAGKGVEIGFGISGSHSWRHTQVGIDYHGSARHYTTTSFYDGVDQSLLVGVKHQFTRHVLLNLRETLGQQSRGNVAVGLPQTIPFDPSQSYIPTTDFFDNRLIFGSTQADLVIQKTSRLSFDFGGSGFFNRRRSSALYGVTGENARADMQYRLSRRTTIGANYNYTHFSFTGIFSSTDIHAANATYAVQLSRRLEFTGFAGASSVETKFVQTVALDPAIVAIIGISQATRVAYSTRIIPNASGRLSLTMAKGVLYLTGGHSVTPGNGLFLTSSVTNVTGGYNYTGLRRWSFTATTSYNDAKSIGNIIGNYKDVDGFLTASRQITRSVHAIASVSARQYDSADFNKYNRLVYTARVGIGWAPGDVPLRIW